MSRIESARFRCGEACRTAGAWILLTLGTTSAATAQAPLFLVNDATRVADVRYRFPEGRTLELDLIESQAAVHGPGAFSSIRNALAWLPLISGAAPIPFSPVELQKDVRRLQRLYEGMGFPAARVSYEVQLDTVDNAVDVAMIVVEGPAVILDSVAVIFGTVQDTLPTTLSSSWADVVTRVGDRRGNRLGERERMAMRAEPLRWARDRGYAFANVSDEVRVDSMTWTAAVEVRLSPGPRARVDSIDFVGNSSLSRRTLSRELPFKTGDWFSASRVNEGQRQIFGLELVRLALGDLASEQAPGPTATVQYRIEEGRPRVLEGETGYSTESGIRARSEWSHRDFLGGGKVLTATLDARSAYLALEGNADRRVTGSLGLRFPYFGDRRVSATVSPFVEYRDGAIDRSWAYGLTSGLLWEKGPTETVAVDYRISRRDVLEIRAGVDGLSQGSFIDVIAALDSLEGGSARSEFSLATTHGRVDDALAPQDGWIVRTRTRVAGPAAISDVEYVRGQFDLARFVPLGPRSGLSLRAGAGALHAFGVSSPTPQSDTIAQLIRLREAMFTAGGTQSVRGWGTGLLGPKLPNFRLVPSGDSLALTADRYVPFAGLARISTSAEIVLPMPFSESDHRTFFFLDGAKVWNPDTRFGGGEPDALGQERFFWGAGGGVSFETIAGPLRVSVGYKLNPSVLDLRDATAVAAALVGGRPLTTVPEEGLRRFHLHLAIGRRF